VQVQHELQQHAEVPGVGWGGVGGEGRVRGGGENRGAD
jgi:hypothetical protein